MPCDGLTAPATSMDSKGSSDYNTEVHRDFNGPDNSWVGDEEPERRPAAQKCAATTGNVLLGNTLKDDWGCRDMDGPLAVSSFLLEPKGPRLR